MKYNKEENYDGIAKIKLARYKIMAGQAQFSIEQLEKEMETDSEVGRKLKSVEKDLENY